MIALCCAISHCADRNTRRMKCYSQIRHQNELLDEFPLKKTVKILRDIDIIYELYSSHASALFAQVHK